MERDVRDVTRLDARLEKLTQYATVRERDGPTDQRINGSMNQRIKRSNGSNGPNGSTDGTRMTVEIDVKIDVE